MYLRGDPVLGGSKNRFFFIAQLHQNEFNEEAEGLIYGARIAD